jgi:catechol 2,3-dioxygenase-like lactoylglutathione lyase family enzyme
MGEVKHKGAPKSFGHRIWRKNITKGKLRHIAISVPDKEKAAQFYEETFGFERVSQARVATRLSDGVMNLTLLEFQTQEDAGDERGKDFVGLHHFGIWVDDIDSMKQAIEAHGGRDHPGQRDTCRRTRSTSSAIYKASSLTSRLTVGMAKR